MNKQDQIKNWIGDLEKCHACALRDEENRGPTRYSGTIASPIMFVGEGPGGVEDIYGVPLVGPSGRLLDKALWSVGLTRDRIYVTNIVKCRPKTNRTPTISEGAFCAERYLRREISVVEPKVIVALGKVAFRYFYKEDGSIVHFRGQWLEWNGIPVMPTFHPAFLLRKTGRDLVDAKWHVYYDLKAAVDKAVSIVPDYTYKSDAMPNLLITYDYLKQKRQITEMRTTNK